MFKFKLPGLRRVVFKDLEEGALFSPVKVVDVVSERDVYLKLASDQTDDAVHLGSLILVGFDDNTPVIEYELVGELELREK